MSALIQKVGIVGAGTMGSGIAAHLANSGIPVVLLDIPTPNLPSEEQDNPAARNRLVETLYNRMLKSRPVQLGSSARADLISIGNTEDDFELLADCDWVVEVIIEKLEPKQALMARLEAVCKPSAIITSNTSGIPISQIAAGRSPEFKARFLGTHFFNPPRYLKLLELIPTADTDPAVIEAFSDFGRNVLGKGVVLCKDTANFIGNRFGAMTGAYLAERALGAGFTVTEADTLVGPLIGRPKTGYFRLADLVGLDIRTNVLGNLYPAVPHDQYRETLKGAKSWALYDQMLENGWIGNKRGQGFYKKTMVNGRREFWTLNLETLDYEPPNKVEFESYTQTAKIRPLAKRIKAILEFDDKGARFVRDVLYFTFAYAAYVANEIAYSIADIDKAVRWGFNYEAGPFELWDMLGVAETAVKMEAAGFELPSWVTKMISTGANSFYGDGTVYDSVYSGQKELPVDKRYLSIQSLRDRHPVVDSNESASLHDMGDGVLLLEFHTKVNALDVDIFAMGYRALELMQTDFDALVVGNEGRHFSVGANLGASASTDWDATAARIRTGQQFMMDLRHAPKPVVTAVHGRALGGGAEIAMQGWRSVAVHEMQIGLVEVNVGLVPAWGGCKETVRRKINPVARLNGGEVLPVLRSAFQQIMQARVSQSAWDAKSLGYLNPTDQIVMNPEHRLLAAKETALGLARSGYRPPEMEKIYAAGRDMQSALIMGLQRLEWGKQMSEYDLHIGKKIANILCGGNLSKPQWVDPWHILDLEREASLSVRGEEKTKARIAHMLKTGKPLRN